MRASRVFRLPCVIFLTAAAVAIPLRVDKSRRSSCKRCNSGLHRLPRFLRTPAMVADWKRSRHARITTAEALKKPEPQRLVSADKIPDKLAGVAVGCAECHMLNPETHKDTFDHNDQKVHLTVTPKDCTTCHSAEVSQYEKNLMSHARVNLVNNPVLSDLGKGN